MSKRSLSSKHVKDDYESDDGFVEDAPKSKKQKKELNTGIQKDDEGNEYWEVREQLRCGVENRSDISTALRQTSGSSQRLQGNYNGRRARILRERWKDVAREEGMSRFHCCSAQS